MFTVCPKCSLTLVVTAADLRVAQGYVRCGRCSNVFNALNALTDERHPEPPAGAAQRAGAPQPQASPVEERSLGPSPLPEAEPAPEPLEAPPQTEVQAEQPAAAEEQDVPVEEPDAAAQEPPPTGDVAQAVQPPESSGDDEELEFDPTSTRVEEIFLAPPGEGDENTGTFEAIVLEGDEVRDALRDEPEEVDPGDAIASDDSELEFELKTLAQRIEMEKHVPAAPISLKLATISPSTAETLQELGVTDDDDDEPSSRVSPWMWRAGIAALLIALLAQGVHHYRRDLALIPQLEPPLAALYGALGVSLEPRWDVNAYDVHQLGAMSDPAAANRLIVRASIKNAAPRAQPLPLLRVAVQDRFGNRIAASDVAPAAYVPAAIKSQSRLASGQRIDVELHFVDPGTQAVGFEIEACLAAPDGGVNCANH